MTLLSAFFMYLGMALLVVEAFFVVPILGFYLAFAFFRDDMDLNPKDL